MPPGRKRPRAGSSAAAAPGSRRRSNRVSSSSAGGAGAGKKSGYFEDDSTPRPQPPRKLARTTAATKTSSARKAKKAKIEEEEEGSSEDVVLRAEEGDGDGDGDDDDDGYDEAEEQYEEEEEEEEEDDDDDGEESSPSPPPKKRARGRPSKSAAAARAPAGNTVGKGWKGGKTKTKTKAKVNDEDDDDDNAKSKSKSKGKGKSKGKAKPKPEEVSELEEEDNDDDDDDEDDDDGDGPRVTFIPLPKLRDAGGVAYEDTRLHRNTLLFLGDLKANNKRSWLKTHDPEYRRSLKDWESFVETLTEKIAGADETIPELPLKDVIFRIYRDIRFTKDPTPYKAHYSAAWSRTGRKGPYACYYVHAEPGHCLVGGGVWHPDAAALARLRAGIDERPHRVRRVLNDPAFRGMFLGGAGEEEGEEDEGGDDDDDDGDESAALRAFVRANREGALKTRPKGFHPEHRDIELLKLRNFTVGKKIRDEDLTCEDAQERIMSIIRPMVPFITYLNKTVMPDPGEDSDSEVEDGDGDEE